MKSEIKLYNMIFPLWAVYLFPLFWIVILPVNFIIDSIVFLIAMAALHVTEKKAKYRKCILRIWGYGFLADIIGAGVLLLMLAFGYVGSDIVYNPLSSPLAFLFTSVGVVLAGVCIYLFNSKKVLPLIDLGSKKANQIALISAIFTAPYAMYIPTPF